MTTDAALVVPFRVPHRSQVTVAIDMLKSYAHMGTFRATVVRAATNTTVAEATVDCLWTDRVSIDAFEYLHFSTSEDDVEYELRVFITSSRLENKVKFLSVTATTTK